MPRQTVEEQIQRVQNELKFLQTYSQLERTKTSTTIEELIMYCQQNQNKDPIINTKIERPRKHKVKRCSIQ